MLGDETLDDLARCRAIRSKSPRLVGQHLLGQLFGFRPADENDYLTARRRLTKTPCQPGDRSAGVLLEFLGELPCHDGGTCTRARFRSARLSTRSDQPEGLLGIQRRVLP